MSTIDVRQPHSLDHDHARHAAELLAQDLAKEFDVDYKWDGDVIRFKRSGAKGYMDVTEQTLHVHLELGLMLRPFKSRIEDEIKNKLVEVSKTA
ncbi:MAG: polyhydroxyalkanoic acid system family protein [Oleiphilaceae bacterium]|nr:polyhydroxyalkanoic acid system family protein [Oleiphilaceae bacterium]